MNKKIMNTIHAGIILSVLYIELQIVYGITIGLTGYRLRSILTGVICVFLVGRNLKNLMRVVTEMWIDISEEQRQG